MFAHTFGFYHFLGPSELNRTSLGPPQSVQNRMSELMKTAAIQIFVIEGSFGVPKPSFESVWRGLFVAPGDLFRLYCTKLVLI